MSGDRAAGADHLWEDNWDDDDIEDDFSLALRYVWAVLAAERLWAVLGLDLAVQSGTRAWDLGCSVYPATGVEHTATARHAGERSSLLPVSQRVLMAAGVRRGSHADAPCPVQSRAGEAGRGPGNVDVRMRSDFGTCLRSPQGKE